MLCNFLQKKIKFLYKQFQKKIIRPGLKRFVFFLSNILEKHEKKTEWKEQVIHDFSSWLAELPDHPPVKDGTALDTCDLFTLLSEFTALRQEIKLQNREQSKTLNSFTSLKDTFRETSELFKQRSHDLDTLEEKIRLASEKKTARLFLDLRDSLTRGLSAAIKVSKSKSFFRPSPKGIDDIAAGYQMTIRRFDRALALIGIYPVQTIDHPFDPKTMRAVGEKTVASLKKEIVIEEQMAGFIRHGEVLRTAEVIVNN